MAGRHGKGGDMATNKQDKLARAYATLSSLRKNIDQVYDVTPRYVAEFHSVLTNLEKIGINLSEFRIPDSEIKPRVASLNYLTGETRYTEEKYVDKSYLLFKIDAILSYFEIVTAEKPRRIGFTKSND